MKFKLLTSNRDLKIKFNKTKNILFIIYENQHTMRERERERERERDHNNQGGKNGPNMHITNFKEGENKIK